MKKLSVLLLAIFFANVSSLSFASDNKKAIEKKEKNNDAKFIKALEKLEDEGKAEIKSLKPSSDGLTLQFAVNPRDLKKLPGMEKAAKVIEDLQKKINS